MKRLKRFTKRKFVLAAVSLFLFYTLIVIWPVRSLVFPTLFGKTLVVLTNEAEARPCGGFASLYGEVSVFPPKANLRNVYGLKEASYGQAEYPLSLVSDTKHFWDAGVNVDLAQCAEDFRLHYLFATEKKIDHVLLVDFGTVEKVVQLWDKITLDGEKINSEDLFAKLSRKVADVDRHDEESLATRKSPLASFGKKMIFKSLNPFLLPKITRVVAKELQNGSIYSSKVSSVYAPRPEDFAVTEWNLGGGKSSRYLQKQLNITAREIEPEKWQWKIQFEAYHAGGWDNPLSHDWKGVFVFDFPAFMNQSSIRREAVIKTGEKYQQGFIFDINISPSENIGLFTPRDQELAYNFSVSPLPQKGVHSRAIETRENVGFRQGRAQAPRIDLSFAISPDTTAPFITLHTMLGEEVIPEEAQEQFATSNTFVEIHFSEHVILVPDFTATLVDRDYTNTDINEDPVFQTAWLKEDQHSLLLGFAKDVQQPGERYYVELSTVKDLAGNNLSKGKRTVIDRVGF